MYKTIEYYFDYILPQPSQGKIWSETERFFASIGVNRINYSYCLKNSYATSVKFSSWKTDWDAHYTDKKLYEHDELVHYCKAGSQEPFDWENPVLTKFKTPKSDMIIQDAKDFGILGGYCYPLPALGKVGPGFFNIVKTKDQMNALNECNLGQNDIAMFVGLLHTRMADLSEKPDTGNPSPFTPRETECLALVSRGLSTKEIAHEAECSSRTVHYHLQNCIRKTKAISRIHALRVAIDNCWI